MKTITVIPQKIAPREICGVVHGGKAFPLTEKQAEQPLQLGLVRMPKTKAVRPAKAEKPKIEAPISYITEPEVETPKVQIDSQDGDAGPELAVDAGISTEA